MSDVEGDDVMDWATEVEMLASEIEARERELEECRVELEYARIMRDEKADGG